MRWGAYSALSLANGPLKGDGVVGFPGVKTGAAEFDRSASDWLIGPCCKTWYLEGLESPRLPPRKSVRERLVSTLTRRKNCIQASGSGVTLPGWLQAGSR